MSATSASAISVWKFAVFAAVLLLCGTVVTSRCLREDCNESQDFSWDYLLFVNQWPESYCLYYNATHRRDNRDGERCIIPQGINNWTIHGTWPTKTGTEGPVNCNKTWPFDLSKIKDLEPELNKMWPDLLAGEPYGSFWSHEWNKHGTCASSLPALYGEHNYFGTTLKLKQTFNLCNILSKHGIVPSQVTKYTFDDIIQALKNGTGSYPHLFCYQNNGSHGLQQYLAEIRLCLDKSFKPLDCPKSEGVKGSKSDSSYYSPCSSKTTIALPPITNPTFA